MGAYAYCQAKGCDCPLSEPTLEQALGEEVWTCADGHGNSIEGFGYQVVSSAIERRINEIIDERVPAIITACARWAAALAENEQARVAPASNAKPPVCTDLWLQPFGVLAVKPHGET